MLGHFLEGTFEKSRARRASHPSTGSEYLGLLVGGMIAIAGIGLAYFCYIARPGVTARLRSSAAAGVHDFLKNKWYFDELIDALVYRPMIAAGRFANDVVERVVVQGIVTGTVGAVRELGAARPRGPVGLHPRLRAARRSAASPPSPSTSWW